MFREERLVKCKVCGSEFYSRAFNARYCSVECRKKGKADLVREWRQTHRLEVNEGTKRRRMQKKIEACSAEHDNCLTCDTPNGECKFD